MFTLNNCNNIIAWSDTLRISLLDLTRKSYQKKTWTNEEKMEVNHHFQKFILLKKLPGKVQIEDVMKSSSVLRARPWKNIKDFIRCAIAKSNF